MEALVSLLFWGRMSGYARGFYGLPTYTDKWRLLEQAWLGGYLSVTPAPQGAPQRFPPGGISCGRRLHSGE